MHRAIREATTSSSGSSRVTVIMEAQEQELQFDEDELRREVSRGAEQARRFEQRFNAAAALPTTACSSLIADAAAVLTTFTSIIKHLNRGDSASKQLAIGARLSSSPPLRTKAGSPASPIRYGVAMPVAMTPPQSPRLASPRSSPAVTPAATPDGSPGVAVATDDQVFDFPDARVPLSRKRKHQPRRVEKVRASSNEQGTEQPPEDGFTWRKYGQKDILNSRHPKSYYRCSFQKDMGCPAVRYVQKSEDEPGYFQVTYIAEHTCKQQQQQQQQQQPQPLSIWSATATRLPTTATSCAALSLTSSGAIQISLPSSYSSHVEDITMASRLSSSRPINPIRSSPVRPMMTPRFGVPPSACVIKAEPLVASSSTPASGSCVSNTSASLGLKEEQMEACEDYEFKDKLTEAVVEGEGRSTDARSNEEIWPSLALEPIYFEDADQIMF